VDSVILDVRDVGYQVFCPLSSFYNFPEIDGEVSLFIYTYVREDDIRLYGFITSEEKELFKLLLSINGVGPKAAIQVLSNMSVDEFVEAVTSRMIDRFKKVPGIGPKASERIILEARDKLTKVFTIDDKGAPQTKDINRTGNVNQLTEDVASALVNLGYNQKSALKAVDQVLIEESNPSFEEVLRKALRILV